MWRLCTASLFRVAGSVTSARVPASLPVPEVVGTCTSAQPRPFTRSAPTTSATVWPLPGRTAASLARSMALPPPKPTTTSGRTVSASREQLLEVGQAGLRLDLAEHDDLAREAQNFGAPRVGGAGDDQGPPQALGLGPAADGGDRTRAELDDRRPKQLDRAEQVAHDRRSSSCRQPRRRQALGILDRLDQAELVGDALAGDVERGAVVDRGADDRQAQRDVHPAQRLPAAGRRHRR